MTQTAAAATHADGAMRLAQAESLLELVHTDVKLARDRALALLESGAEDEADAVALRVVGLSLRFSDPQRASEQLRRAVSLAQRLRLPVRAAQARTTHVVVLAQLGRTRSALRQAVLAETVLRDSEDELELARLRVNHGLVLQRIGRQAEALTRFGAAEPVLRRYGDVRWEVMLRNLRGTL